MRKFLENWTDLLADPDVSVDPEGQRRLLVYKLNGSAGHGTKSIAMQLDIQHQDRLPPGHEDFTHDWLIGRMYRHLERQRDEANEAAYNKQMGELFGTGKIPQVLQAQAARGLPTREASRLGLTQRDLTMRYHGR